MLLECVGSDPNGTKMRREIFLSGMFLVLLCVNPRAVWLLEILTGPDGQPSPQTLSLPYAFYDDSFGTPLSILMLRLDPFASA